MTTNKITGPPMGFYPPDKSSLQNIMQSFEKKFEKMSLERPNGKIRGLVVPHAGLIYSGFTAYCAYKLFSQQPLPEQPVIVLLAPSHQSFFEGMVTSQQSTFQTPLGDLPTADRYLEPLLQKPWVDSSPGMHRDEHSLQVQIPFLQYLFNDGISIQLLPFLLSGNYSSEQWTKIFDDFLSLLPKEKDVYFIASSDLYHGESYDTACAKDQKTIQGILKDPASEFWHRCLDRTYMACGCLPIFALKYMAEKGGFLNTQVVHRTNSNDVIGEIGGYVVGYTSILFCE